MWWTLSGSATFVFSFLVLWYWLFLRWNRRRAKHLLASIESAFGGNGHVSSTQWLSASQFHVQLRLGNSNFMQPTVTVRMLPREVPWHWAMCVVKKRRETLTFDANLPCPPGFNLEVQNQRWSAKSRKRVMRRRAVTRLRHLGPFVLTSRHDWQRDITSMMHALATSRDCDLLSVSFRRRTPHFSATVPLEAVAGKHCTSVRVFEALRELAAGASAARF